MVPSLGTAIIFACCYEVICAALAKRNAAVGNQWLDKRLAMGHSSHVSNLITRMRKSLKDLRILKNYETRYGDGVSSIRLNQELFFIFFEADFWVH